VSYITIKIKKLPVLFYHFYLFFHPVPDPNPLVTVRILIRHKVWFFTDPDPQHVTLNIFINIKAIAGVHITARAGDFNNDEEYWYH
jgi:hypothetical protein